MASDLSLILQLLLQTQYREPDLQIYQLSKPHLINDPISRSSNFDSSIFTNADHFDDGCDLNIFEQDTCSNTDPFSKINQIKEIDRIKRNSLRCRKWLWPDRSIPFVLGLKSESIIEKFLEAIDELNNLQCVTFIRLIDPEEVAKLTDQRRKYLNVREIDPLPGRSCQASLGSIGRHPRLDISHVCTKGQIIHELMHVLGFAHEHQRPDRDRYVRIRCDHIMPNVSQDFRRMRSRVINDWVTEDDRYDFQSIMHYRLDHFSMDGQKTIEPVDKEYLKMMGVREEDIGSMRGLSDGDIARIKRVYGCIDQDTVDR